MVFQQVYWWKQQKNTLQRSPRNHTCCPPSTRCETKLVVVHDCSAQHSDCSAQRWLSVIRRLVPQCRRQHYERRRLVCSRLVFFSSQKCLFWFPHFSKPFKSSSKASTHQTSLFRNPQSKQSSFNNTTLWFSEIHTTTTITSIIITQSLNYHYQQHS